MLSSSISRMTKSKWYLKTTALRDPTLPAPFIDWSTLFEGAVGGTKHERAALLQSARGLLAAMIENPATKGSHQLPRNGVVAATVYNWFIEIRHFVWWLVRQGRWSFSSVTSIEFYEYLVTRGRGKTGSRLKSITYATRFAIYRRMWLLRGSYKNPLNINPETLEIDPPRRGREHSSWKALDDDVALPLIGDALMFAERFGDLMVEVHETIWRDSNRVGLAKWQRRAERTRLYKLLEQDPRVAELRDFLQMGGQKTHHVLASAIGLIKGACITVILFFVGMRIGELARLDVDCIEDVGLQSYPDSVYLRGVAAKQRGRSRRWIGSVEVRAAVSMIIKLNACARTAGESPSALFLSHRCGYFLNARRKLCRTGATTLTKHLKGFAQARFRSSAPKVARIHPHMARKTFARFVVRRDKRALGSLSRHYGHISSAITDGHYVGADIELEKLLSEESRADLANALHELLSAPHVGGKAADKIGGMRASAVEFRGKRGVTRLVERLIDQGVVLAPCDWGFCVYSQAHSACKGSERGPNEVLRSPDVCSSCSNFAVTERHRGWWEARLLRDEEFLKQPALTEQAVAWVTRRSDQSRKIVSSLLPLSRKAKG